MLHNSLQLHTMDRSTNIPSALHLKPLLIFITILACFQSYAKPIPIVVQARHVSCAGGQDGALEFNFNFPLNFVFPSEVLVTNGEQQFENGQLAAGYYCLEILNGLGETIAEGCAHVLQPSQKHLQYEVKHACGDQGGAIKLFEQSKTYTFYNWRDQFGNSNSGNRDALAAGNYYLTVTDLQGCEEHIGPIQVQNECGSQIEFLTLPTDITVSPEKIPIPITPVVRTSCEAGELKLELREQIEEGDCPGNYIIRRRWVASDRCGGEHSEWQQVTVVDKTAPTFPRIDEDVEVNLFKGEKIPPLPMIIAKDNGTGQPAQQHGESVTQQPYGRLITRWWKAQDGCGNHTAVEQQVKVIQNQSPDFLESNLEVRRWWQEGTIDQTLDQLLLSPNVPQLFDNVGLGRAWYRNNNVEEVADERSYMAKHR